MNIAFYAPFKPLDHPTPSGDQTIARGLTAFLRDQGEIATPVSRLRSRGICDRPWLWPGALLERARALEAAKAVRARLWLTYHAYYKAPDLLGPYCARRLGVPYAIFQGIYSTKVKKRWRTRLGFELNRASLLAADRIFTNKLRDLENLRRLVPEERLTYAAPGIRPGDFAFSAKARQNLRLAWGAAETPVVMTAAMFRDDVKTRGLIYLFERLGELARQGLDFLLAVAGEGPTRERLEALAARELPGRHLFLGLVPRVDLGAIYSAADLFAFPGINESLGMVFLEAQSVGLPIVAFDNDGLPEVAEAGVTGFLTTPFNDAAFREAIRLLVTDRVLRREMGEAAQSRIRERHDLDRNYGAVLEALRRLARDGK